MLSELTNRDPTSLRVIAVGDVCPGEHYFTLGHGLHSSVVGGLKLSDVASLDLKRLLATSNILIGNLEGPISEHSTNINLWERRAFRGDAKFAAELRSLSFTHMSIANNHILQHGVDAAAQTLDILQRVGIKPTGLRSRADGWLCEPTYVEGPRELRCCLLAYSSVPDAYIPGQLFYSTCDDWDLVIKDVQQARRNSDAVIVAIHGGLESRYTVDPELKIQCERLSEAGASAVFLHHTHTSLPMHTYCGVPIYHGLGNFIFDMPWSRRYRTGAMGVVDFQLTERGGVRVRSSAILGTRFSQDFRGQFSLHVDAPVDQATIRLPDRVFLRLEPVFKLAFYLTNLFRGDFHVKLSFLIHKLSRALLGIRL